MELQDYREQLNEIDSEMVSLFGQRMKIVQEIGTYKKEHGMPILDKAQERRKIKTLTAQTDKDLQGYVQALYQLIFELSRSAQAGDIYADTPLQARIRSALQETPQLFPRSAVVACQGVEGAYSQSACERLFRDPDIMYFKSFENVFAAIDQGFCEYGILPLENSSAGSVKRVYDLMMHYDFSIVKSVRIKVDHNLLANKGVSIGDIREIYSHEQAIRQCEGFLKTLKDVQVHVCENTAEAARLVSESGRKDIAALASRSCAELYDLEVLKESCQDNGNNHTRFICISKKLEIYPGADRTSIMVVTENKPGALYQILSKFYVQGINLTKLESRPIPDRDFEFMFYFDIETSVYAPEFATMIGELEASCISLRYLGTYSEII